MGQSREWGAGSFVGQEGGSFVWTSVCLEPEMIIPGGNAAVVYHSRF